MSGISLIGLGTSARSPDEAVGGAVDERVIDGAVALALAAGVALSRVPFVVPFAAMGKDGPLYIEALRLDSSFEVPMPGNIGFVLLGKLALLAFPDPIQAYAAVNACLVAVGVAFTYLLGRQRLGRPLAALAGAGLAVSPLVWWHGGAISSYPVWLAVLPMLAWSCARLAQTGASRDAVAAGLILGVGSILRQDLLMFGGPLWLVGMMLGRPPWKAFLSSAAIVGVCCVLWMGITSQVMGGLDRYLAAVDEKHGWHVETFSVQAKGLIEGLARNGVKYGLFLGWTAWPIATLSLLGLASLVRSIRTEWKPVLLGAAWVAPSVGFSLWVFAGNAGLVFPALPPLYLLAALAVSRMAERWPNRPALVGTLGVFTLLAGGAQFLVVPVSHEQDQREVILNVMLARYSAAGLEQRYNYNLDDFGIDPSLRSVVGQMKRPEAVPTWPAGRLAFVTHTEERVR